METEGGGGFWSLYPREAADQPRDILTFWSGLAPDLRTKLATASNQSRNPPTIVLTWAQGWRWLPCGLVVGRGEVRKGLVAMGPWRGEGPHPLVGQRPICSDQNVRSKHVAIPCGTRCGPSGGAASGPRWDALRPEQGRPGWENCAPGVPPLWSASAQGSSRADYKNQRQSMEATWPGDIASEDWSWGWEPSEEIVSRCQTSGRTESDPVLLPVLAARPWIISFTSTGLFPHLENKTMVLLETSWFIFQKDSFCVSWTPASPRITYSEKQLFVCLLASGGTCDVRREPGRQVPFGSEPASLALAQSLSGWGHPTLVMCSGTLPSGKYPQDNGSLWQHQVLSTVIGSPWVLERVSVCNFFKPWLTVNNFFKTYFHGG